MESQQPSSRGMFWIPAGLAAVVVLMAAIFGAVGSYNLRTALGAKTWRTAQATVTASGRSRYEHRDPRDGTYRTLERLEFAYQFDLDGRRYQGSRMNPTGMQSVGRATLAQHPVGSSLSVFYDPADPTRSALTTESGLGDYLFAGISGLLFLLSVPFWALSFRWWKKGRAGA